VVHSASKYLNGHSDVLAGAVVAAESDAFWQRIRAWRRDAGAVLGPFEAWLLLRGMRTLFVRVGRCSESAMAIARHFEGHPRLRAVLYPGLPGHPGHAVAKRQMTGGFGGMLSIRLRDGEAAAVATAAKVAVFKRATSLGGVESLIEHRASIEGPSTPVPGDLLRLSIGLEKPEDLIADLERALAASAAAKPLPIEEPALEPESPNDLVARIEKLLEQRIHPILADRGGGLELRDFADGVLTLGLVGSPGASLPIRSGIVNLVRHYLPEVAEVRFATEGGGRSSGAGTGESVTARLRRVLDEQIIPAVAAHGGSIALIEVEEGTAFLRFEGRCQGCAMADVTLRQGVEVMIKQAVPEIIAIVDRTDHAAGTDPYFKTKKGA
jgi:Fe-S cluster biogenesis protein NfuA